MTTIKYTPSPKVCTKQIDITINNGKVEELLFHGGCHGNTQGISSLVRGMQIEDVISRLEGITCGARGTSCPWEVVKALKQNL